ncbi:nucleoside diphosphate phosphatase ENTPD5 isoform X2 [Osmia lignaria lignaria]|uniref:ectonucleoside triphosphate diphosphohydrolase 5 isoform X2 n=1 Tax=Osmia lignaria TaxID=473952 RepID=UPI0014791110|nr:ectonucleoside triphosphate diphosphohydrolase 5 isoform X2 [Osmia lignaria]XP_034190450.1 ectonucleoside triphosphate diphosphohydrolase 5 isoform X2 [Osmia lignaria]XP_034190452.1 ectonucleoside triphosphate diphosphohydrolase 5 isoform X2 [Osmia lignaria]
MEVRHRKLRTENEDIFEAESKPRFKKGQPGKRYFVVVALLGILFLGYIAIAYDLKPVRLGSKAIDTLAFSFNLQKPFYVVVIDAGSTGSRALAFSFHESILGGNLVLDEELYTETKPGLSAYSERPKDAAKSLIVLLDKVRSVIPRSEWQHTPLTMRATAGLRLLPGHKAQEILQECRKMFEESGFLLSKNSISIMEGRDEGIFSWFTVNFLSERFNTHNPGSTVAALDLGGGSTQVTFSPNPQQEKKLDGHIYSVNIFNHNMSVYTHSYLGMGLMAARKEILTYGMNLDNVNPKTVIQSECINPIVSTEWSYGGVNYIIKGPVNGTHKLVKTQNFAGGEEDRPIVNFPECLKIIEKYVGRIKNKPEGLKDHEIYAFSYYFDRATEVGLVDPFFGGAIQVSAFLKHAKEACDYPNTDQPFICLDLTFIYILLRDGFGLEPTTKLYLYKKINGHELSWALGAAFNIIQNGL